MPENTDKIQDRTPQGRFIKGKSGNPQGKPKGTRHKATQAAMELMQGQLEQITQGLVDAAVNGDMTAVKIIIDKLIPPSRESVIPPIEFPSIDKAADMPKLTQKLLDAVGNGEVLPSQAAALSSLITAHGKSLELYELEERLSKLEEAANE